MGKDIDLDKETEEIPEEEQTAENTEETASENSEETSAGAEKEELSETDKLKAELADSKDKYLRLMAEYDNFRKRSAKERLELTDSAKGNAVNEILPVFDNFERALGTETQDTAYKQGVEMIFKQFGDALGKLGVEIIDPIGETFDPNIANAVNQIEDPELGENVVAQVFQKGYKIGNKVIRYAMVVVANP
ncbi:MAG: nucleotide exchange factor GrpE [Ruminococcus sp.]|nr:nucleotide exchange factor GrpE [Ruminococcus sp.]